MESSVSIKLDNYHGVCYPGQTLAGKVECVFASEKTVRAVRIQFKGRAKVEWKVKSGKSSTTYWSKEVYFDQVFNLVGGDENELQMEAGQYTYPFSYILPQSLPSSYEGSYGEVRYSIKSTVDLPWKLDYEDLVILTVASPLNLNVAPRLRVPFEHSLEEVISSCCCATQGPITFSVSLPVTGYAVNQKIPVRTYVQNMSNINVESVRYEIKETAEFIAQHPWERRRETDSLIAMINTDSIGAHADKSWTTSLDVSLSGYRNLLPCSIINITHHLKVKLILPFPHSNIKITCPLMFGTVPLTDVNNVSTELESPLTVATMENTAFLENFGPSEYNAASQPSAPPTYEEAERLKQSTSNN